MDRIISNIEGLRNPTILQQLEAMRKYILENAKQGAPGVQGMFTVDADYTHDTQYYPIASVRNYVADAFVGQVVYFNNGYSAIVAQVYDSTPIASPAFTVTDVVDIRGPGRGITRIENAGVTVGEGFTLTHVEVDMTDGTQESFDVRAENGQAEIPFITIASPASATNGNLTATQLATLQSNPLAYISFDKELYYPMDKEHEAGFLTYTHNGFNSTGSAFTDKAITVNVNNLSWVLTANNQKAPAPDIGLHHIQFFGEPEPKDIWPGTSWEIDTAMQGRVPIGSGGEYVFGATGGSPDAVAVEHRHEGAVWDDTPITLGVEGGENNGYSVPWKGGFLSMADANKWTTVSAGESGVGKNMMPYIVVNYWKRTA